MFNLEKYINECVIKRPISMFKADIDNHNNELSEMMLNQNVLVIGGAGSIGSSFIKAILPYRPKGLVVVDTNENALTELTRDLRSSYGLHFSDDYVTYPMNYSSSVFARMFKVHGGFDLVANFSAHKHVRSEKDIYSVEALLQKYMQ